MTNDAENCILLVEDYEPNIMVAEHYLEYLGYRSAVARSGREAFEMCKAKCYLAVLMDVQMPEMDGFEATKLIREYESENNLPRAIIIGMTAHAFVGDKQRCIDAGMDDYVPKPVSEEELRDKLKMVLPKIGE